MRINPQVKATPYLYLSFSGCDGSSTSNQMSDLDLLSLMLSCIRPDIHMASSASCLMSASSVSSCMADSTAQIDLSLNLRSGPMTS